MGKKKIIYLQGLYSQRCGWEFEKNHVAMAAHHSLRSTGGTGSKNDEKKISGEILIQDFTIQGGMTDSSRLMRIG